MKTRLKLSPWASHVERWADCTRCTLHHGRRNVVLARGRLPCDVLLVGEAPGKSEDALGQPFVGPAGHLLDEIVAEALEEQNAMRAEIGGRPLRVAFTNLVACVPKGEDGEKLSEPDADEIIRCRPRLVELVRMARPSWIVLVGALPRRHVQHGHFDPVDWLPDSQPLRFVAVDHPAYVLRANFAQRGLLIQKAVVTIRSALAEPF